MSIYSSKRKTRRGSRHQLGHLKLSVYEESTALVVTIFEARGLLRKENAPLETYVKLYLLPDPQKQTKEKTRSVKQKDPVFNQKFSFLLTDQDQARRLFVSVWSHHSTSRNEIIGCMSFLVSDLLGPNKGINGWYQLLDEQKGKNENMPVPTSLSRYEPTGFGYQRPGQRIFAVTLVRSPRGYGFSVHGLNPVYITHVEEGMPAQLADLQVGDVIVEVENTDVTKASGDLVVSIIKKCPQTVHLILQRDATSPLHRARAHTTAGYPPASVFPSQTLSQSFTSIPSYAPSRTVRLIGPQHSSQVIGSGRGPRRYSNPKVQSPVHYTQGGVLSQPMGPRPYYYGMHPQHGGAFAPIPQSTSPWYNDNLHSSIRGQIPEESGLELSPPPEPQPGLQREASGSIGSGSTAHSRRHGSRSPQSGESHEQLHPNTETSSTSAMSRYAFSQPGGGEMDFVGMLPPSTRYPAATTIAGARYPHGQSEMMMMMKHSMTQLSSGYNSELAERGMYGRSEASLPMRHPHVYQSAPMVSAGYHPRALAGGKVNATMMSSNGSIAADSAYASGLSNQSSNLRSPVDMDDGSRFVGPGMRPNGMEERHTGSSHYLQVSRSSLTGSRDSSQFGRVVVEEEVSVDWESLGPLSQKRQRAIHSLMNAEFSFYDELRTGIETYMEPLRTIIPDTTHHTIFLHLDQLFVLSQEIMAQLKGRRLPYSTHPTPVPSYVGTVGDIYHSRINRVLLAFEGYLRNSFRARQEIALSFTNQEFTKLVQDSVVGEKKPSIYSFIESGKEYLPKVTKFMMAVSFFTPLWHEDHKYLTNIIQALLRVCPERELILKWERDRETMESLRLCIGFSAGVQPFRVVTPGRVLLHEGEVTLVEKRKKKKIWMMLFSDILLLTRRQGKIFSTMQTPVLLEQLMVQDLNCSEATEFQITTVDGSFSRLVRAHTPQNKMEWMQKLRERATGSLTHRRRVGDRMSPVQRNLPKFEYPRRQPSQAEDELEASFLSTATAIEGSVTGKNEASSRRLSQQDVLPNAMDRGGRQRRSLFNVGARVDRSGGRGRDRPSKGRRAPAPLIPHRRLPPTLDNVSVAVLKQWESSFEALLQDSDGIELFENFLKSEFSEENIQFWKACERYKGLPKSALQKEAEMIFDEFISQQAPKLVNIDHQTTKEIIENMKSPDYDTFTRSQQSIYLLMARDSFVRFVRSELFQAALRR